MFRITKLALTLCLLVTKANSQILIPNGDFEAYTSLPILKGSGAGIYQIKYGWKGLYKESDSGPGVDYSGADGFNNGKKFISVTFESLLLSMPLGAGSMLTPFQTSNRVHLGAYSHILSSAENATVEGLNEASGSAAKAVIKNGTNYIFE